MAKKKQKPQKKKEIYFCDFCGTEFNHFQYGCIGAKGFVEFCSAECCDKSMAGEKK